MNTKDQGLTLIASGKWNGAIDNTKFMVTGHPDSDYAKDGETKEKRNQILCVFE